MTHADPHLVDGCCQCQCPACLACGYCICRDCKCEAPMMMPCRINRKEVAAMAWGSSGSSDAEKNQQWVRDKVADKGWTKSVEKEAKEIAAARDEMEGL